MAPWNIRDVALGVLCIVMGVVVVALIGGLLSISGVSTGVAAVVITAVLGCVMVATALWLGPVRHRASPGSLGLRLSISRGHLLLAVGVLGGSLAFNFVYSMVVDVFHWGQMTPPDISSTLGFTGVAAILGPLVLVLWGPFGEEMLFRGFMFAGLAGPIGTMGAALASAVLFALAHGDISIMIPAFFTGVLLAWLYWRTRSLWPCLLAHAAQNALALSIPRT